MAIDTHSPLFNNSELASRYLEHQTETERMRIERGLLGNLWGSSSSIPNNIAAFLLILSLFIGAIYTCIAINLPPNNTAISIRDFWSIMSPFITGPLGFLFGIKKGNK